MAWNVSAVRTCDGLFLEHFRPWSESTPLSVGKLSAKKAFLKGPHLLPELFYDVLIETLWKTT